MSWLYRFFTKSDNEQVVTIAAPYVQITGTATVTGGLTQSSGALAPANLNVTTAATAARMTVTGTMAVGGAATFVNNLTVSGTTRHIGYIYLGTGTKCIAFGTDGIDPIANGIDNCDKGSIFMGGTANLYFKTDYSSTSWASADAYD